MIPLPILPHLQPNHRTRRHGHPGGVKRTKESAIYARKYLKACARRGCRKNERSTVFRLNEAERPM